MFALALVIHCATTSPPQQRHRRRYVDTILLRCVVLCSELTLLCDTIINTHQGKSTRWVGYVKWLAGAAISLVDVSCVVLAGVSEASTVSHKDTTWRRSTTRTDVSSEGQRGPGPVCPCDFQCGHPAPDRWGSSGTDISWGGAEISGTILVWHVVPSAVRLRRLHTGPGS